MESDNRVVVLIDMDCFYCQVEEKLNPELTGQPIAVVQYNPWKGGGIIAVNYVARAMGVMRNMRGDEAKAKCPDIKLPSVPCSRGKADITKYRDAGKEVAKVLQKFTSLLERASIDEAYLDITGPVQERLNTLNVHSVTNELLPNTYALGYGSLDEFLTDVHSCGSDSIEFDYEHAKCLLVGAIIVSEIRAAVYEETGYRCSAGIAHNKILAKLVCGMNKPNKQTILPKHSINILYKTLPVRKVKHLGGKFGDTVCQILSIKTMAELQVFSEKHLQNRFDDKNGTWLYNIARGVDMEPVQAKFNPKSIGCCKQFRGKSALLDLESVRKWLKDLGDEIEDRLEKDALENNRSPRQIVVSYSTRLQDGRDTSSSRSYNFTVEDELTGDFFSSKAFELLLDSSEGVKSKDGESNRRLKAPIEFLGLSVGKFQDHVDERKSKKIKDYFSASTSKVPVEKLKDIDKQSTCKNKNNSKEYILQKFFKATSFNEEKVTVGTEVATVSNPTVFESSLDKQESFFANILNKKSNSSSNSIDSEVSHQTEAIKPSTPVCEVIDCGEDSVDTDYSSSTINMEINKSIALFEDDPKDIDRIDNIRELLKSSSTNLDQIQETSDSGDVLQSNNYDIHDTIQNNKDIISHTAYEVDTIICSECGKPIPIHTVETHADYHLALKLRDEERQQLRNYRDKKSVVNVDKKKSHEEPAKLKKRNAEDHTTSITNFLVKLDVTIPTDTCTECGKKIPIEKFSEHLDFHEAQKLSRELNRRPANHTGSSITKRKRSSTSPVKKLKVPNCKSIDSFFK